MVSKIVYVCGEEGHQAEIMAQHKVLANNGFIVVSYGDIKDFDSEKEKITETIKGVDVVWVLSSGVDMGDKLKAQVEIAQALNKKIVYVG